MTDQKTIAIFGAGTGLGASVAARFGREGYKIALIARGAAGLDLLKGKLAEQGIEAHSFPADLSDLAAIPSLVHAIETRLGPIEVALFSPISSTAYFVPAVDLKASYLQSISPLLTWAPIELAHALMPGMRSRGDGAFIVADGLSAVFPVAGMSGPGPAMAATRNYIMTLHEEVRPNGVLAGMLHVGAMIDNSAGMAAALAAGMVLDSFPVVDPEVLADEVWNLATKRDRSEAILPQLPR
ncbi:SDR family NAD(P)-dependent oxidoreductase [Devosia sp. Root105]|uniref:SDR family NAD(P)-dependent oxidoreductase n=1 Tax=Devosia sp. Root105 TaxID=1736423 RepID=UPI0006FF025B|nr:SDR family NAD(P)-dependent oxidoreductase [Devosia sp. Root105]KQU99273.1 short-chain dehydrogenase [Devosia sp. Root105]